MKFEVLSRLDKKAGTMNLVRKGCNQRIPVLPDGTGSMNQQQGNAIGPALPII
ncbi:MAG: hypothetical protein KAH09_07770 [Desulfobacula sp.]|nr:hypothetical protein [Desulfobacula sp.]